MQLGTEEGLSPGDVMLDGDPAPPKRGTAPNFRPYMCTEPCTRHSIHHMAVYTGRVRCHQWTRPVHGHGLCTRPCTRPSLRPICKVEHTGRKDVYTARVYGRIHSRVHMYSTGTRVLDRVHGRVQAVDRRTRPVQAAYTVCSRPCIGRVHGP